MNRTTGKKYYLNDVFDETIEFLTKYTQETVATHLKNDSVELSSSDEYHDYNHGTVTTIKIARFDTLEEVYKAIAKFSVLNTDTKKFKKEYNKFFYDKKGLFPTLNETRGKIILLTRGNWKYNATSSIGNELNIPDMGECEIYPVKNDQKYQKECYPHIHNSNSNVLVQDNYNLSTGKWKLVEEYLEHKIPIVYNDIEYSMYNDLTNSFYDVKNATALTVDFINIQGFAGGIGIYNEANKMNNNLSKYIGESKKIHNHWFILDYPTNDLVRKIRNSMTPYSLEKRNEQINIIQIDDFVVYTDLDYYIESKEDACLQLRVIINKEGYEQEIIKTNFKCLNNKKKQMAYYTNR